MYVCMYIFLYTYTDMYILFNTHIHIYIYIYALYIYMYDHVCIDIPIYVRVCDQHIATALKRDRRLVAAQDRHMMPSDVGLAEENVALRCEKVEEYMGLSENRVYSQL